MTANNVACVLPASKLDEFGAISIREEQLRLGNLAIQLKSEAHRRGWIMVYGGGRMELKQQAGVPKELSTFW